MENESKDRLFFGVLSSRELFYLLFGITVVIVLVFYGWAFGSDGDERPHENPKFANGRYAASIIGSRGGIPISDTELLFFDGSMPPTNTWSIYNTADDKISDGSRFARPLFGIFDDYRDLWKSIRWSSLAGWNGNIVLTVLLTNSETVVFEWKTNQPNVHVFKPADYSGGQRFLSSLALGRIVPSDDGWLYAYGFYNWSRPLLVTGARFGPMSFAHPYPSNCVLNSTFPFDGRVYVTGIDTNTSLISITILSLTNQSTIFSNPAVKMPVASDYCAAQPDPSGRRVVWIFERDPKIAIRIFAILPASLRPRSPPGPTYDYYVSDLHAGEFHFICAIHGQPNYPVIWGVNGNSIWLSDPERGIKRYDLK